MKFRMLLQNYIQHKVCCLSKYWLRYSVCIMILLCVFQPKTSSYSATLYFFSKNSSENPWAKLKINIRNMWKKGCDHDVVLLIFGTRFLAQTATEKHPNKHSVQNKRSLVQESKLISKNESQNNSFSPLVLKFMSFGAD